MTVLSEPGAVIGCAFMEDILIAKASGMNGHLAEPLDIPAMKRGISKFIGSSSQTPDKSA